MKPEIMTPDAVRQYWKGVVWAAEHHLRTWPGMNLQGSDGWPRLDSEPLVYAEKWEVEHALTCWVTARFRAYWFTVSSVLIPLFILVAGLDLVAAFGVNVSGPWSLAAVGITGLLMGGFVGIKAPSVTFSERMIQLLRGRLATFD